MKRQTTSMYSKAAATLLLSIGLLGAGSASASAISFQHANYIVPGLDYPGGATDAGLLTPSNEFTGVGDLIISYGGPQGRCTGSYLGDGVILTAAHCISDNGGALSATGANITFTTPGGTQTHAVSEFHIHPDYTGSTLEGNDVAILKLATTPTGDVDSYGLYSTGDEIGKTFHKVGYGRSGTGATGSTVASGTKRDGFNVFDRDGTQFQLVNGIPLTDLESILLYDFDNDNPINDAFRFFFGIAGLAVDGEVNTAPGDSGGPAFIDGLIAGVTSFGITLTNLAGTSDILAGVNSSFGEFSADARVSDAGIYSWITSFFADEPPPVAVALPAPLAMLLLGLAFMARRRSH